MSEETREMLIERFKAHLSRSASHSIDNEKKYFELRPDASGAQVYWSLRGEWYVEGELYDRDGHYDSGNRPCFRGNFSFSPPSCLPLAHILVRTKRSMLSVPT